MFAILAVRLVINFRNWRLNADHLTVCLLHDGGLFALFVNIFKRWSHHEYAACDDMHFICGLGSEGRKTTAHVICGCNTLN